MVSDIKYLEHIRAQCTKCNNIGVVPTTNMAGDIVLTDCECSVKVERAIKLIKANIPARYREFDLETGLERKFEKDNASELAHISAYVKNLPENIRAGKRLWLWSKPGLAKSSIISYVLRKAIDAGYSAYCARASHLIQLKLDALRNPEKKELVDHIVDRVDILAIEEIEKVYLTANEDFIPNTFFELLSDLHDTKKAILLSSNRDPSEVLSKFPDYIYDRFKAVRPITFTGTSPREKLEK